MNIPRTPGLPFILVTLTLDMIGLGIIIPITPALVLRLAGTADDAARALGLLIGLYALAQLLAAPTLGALSDRFGRRPVLLMGTLLTAMSYALAALAPTLGWLVLARALGGAGSATVGVAHAYIADVSTPHNRARHFGLAGAAFGLGLIVGPAIGGLLGGFDLRVPFILAGTLALLNLFYGAFILPESRRSAALPLDLRHLIPLRNIGILRQFPGLPILAVVSFLATLATQFTTSTWVLHGTARYGWTPGVNGLTLACAGFLGVAVQVALLPRVLARLGNERTLLLALVCGVIGNLLYGLAAQPWMLFAVMPIATLLGLGAPPLQALIVGRTTEEAQGAVQGAISAVNALASILGPLAATQLFAQFAAGGSPPPVPGVAFFGTGLILVVTLGVARRVAPRPNASGDSARAS
ncbi:MAG: major facilitator superfamily 1 [Deinococcus sp.]|nr:major facilitator superfamily 1 [Deinococcus sp.]